MTTCGTLTNKSWPKVSLVASRISKATAATACKHPNHPGATLSSHFKRSHGSVPHPPSLGQYSHSRLVLFSHVKSKRLSRVWQVHGGPDVTAPGLSSVTSGTCFASLGGCLPPKPQGIVELTLSLHCLAHPVSLPGDCATSIHLEGLPRGRVNRWLSPFEKSLSLGERPLVPPI